MKELSRESKAIWAKAFLKRPLKTKYLFKLIGDAWQIHVKAKDVDVSKYYTEEEKPRKNGQY